MGITLNNVDYAARLHNIRAPGVLAGSCFCLSTIFARASRVQEAVVSVTDRAYIALEPNQYIMLNILMLQAVGMVEALTLIGNGMGHGAMKIVRSMVENAINTEFIRRFPLEGEKYKEWYWVETHKLYQHLRETSPEALKQIPQEKIAEDFANYERVKGLFRYTAEGKNGVKRTIKQESWSRHNLYERAKLTDKLQTYTTVMPFANQILHGSVSGLISHMENERTGGRISNPPNHNWGGEALIAAHTALLETLQSTSEALDVMPSPAMSILKADHDAIWGGTAPAGLT